jgi:hypothetical protein
VRTSRLGGCAVLVLLVAAAACGSTGFQLGDLTVDSSHTCTAGSIQAAYDLQGTVPANNGTSQTVMVRSADAVMIVVAVHGPWRQALGSRYDAGQVTFSPTGIGAGSNTTLKVTIPSACTNGAHTGVNTSYADYSVELTIVTTAGTFKLTSRNRHRILAP